MEFREGMLGVVIVALALTAALGISYFAGIESSERTVIDYEYLADVSGLFDYDKSPQYIDYDPSTNYVGYYSQDTGEYWPVDDVGYEENPSVNNYRVNLEPETISSGNVSLDTYTTGTVDPFSDDRVYVTFYNRDATYYTSQLNQDYPTTVTLKSYIAAMELDESVTDVEIRSIGTYTENNVGMEYRANWVVFTTKSMWTVGEAALSDNVHLNIASQGWFDANGHTAPYTWTVGGTDITYTTYLPCLSCSIDLTTGIVTLYYDNDCKKAFSTSFIDSTYMTYGGSQNAMLNTIIFDGTANIKTMHKDKEYLNPNYGVKMES